MRRWVRRGLPVVAGIVLGVAGTTLGSIAASSPGPATQPQSLIVSTGAGQIEGRTTGTVDQFLGVPYAAPPTRARRWQPPQPVTPWTGVRSALSYGGRCAQLTNGNGPRIDNEDCLYLNVYAPAVIKPGKKLPVMFMIHGGGLTTGAGDQQDGSLLASSQNIIVVSVNYRLGPFGFLALPGLDGAGSGGGAKSDGNFGLLDQEAALRWVRQNIAGFGGDPGQVTIAGESAGGWSVCGLLASPPARGLFARAIMESGSCVSQPLATAQQAGAALAAKVGCTDPGTVTSCLRAVPEATLLSASSSYQPLLTVGGTDLPAAPASAVAAGSYTKVPILIGTNHDEGRTFAQGEAGLTEAQYTQYVKTTFGALAPQVLARYPWSAYHGPHPYTAAYAIGAIETDAGLVGGIGGCPEQNLAGQLAGTGSATYFFQFDDRHAPGLNHDLPGYQWGAGHAMELAYLWPSFTNGFSLYAELTPAQLQLSRQMIAYWGAFVRTGVPSAPGSPGWPRYSAGGSPGGARLMSLRPGGATRVIPGPEFAAEHQCSFWNGAGQGAEG
ncbi:MAG TPA: carboxylesterase family protein [Streptosporangiaceae bacterium]